jgi:RNA polymerase sigma-70 factor (ECF subfamily)
MPRPIDRNAVDRLVVEHLPAALRLALRLTRDPHAAEDLVQEMLLRVLARWRTFRGDASFKTWMLGILMNVDRDRRRGLRVHQPVALPIDPPSAIDSHSSPLAAAVANEVRGEIQAAVDRLPERQREVAVLSWGEGLAAAEVATVLGVSEANVYTNLHLARKRLAQALGVDVLGRSVP